MKEHFQVVISIGSSEQEIRDKLNTAEGCVTFCATRDFKLYMHHHASHIGIRNDQGVTYGEVLVEGYAHVLLKKKYASEKHDRLVISPKDSGEDRATVVTIERLVREFLVPLWVPNTPLV